ncbi:hypothetical protein B0H17DRAFT_1195485 [Mycena rosella]|uniref:Glucose-methanol-choline oxidoreductase N-terminal domain-containing protein n=1 Tax=Mycena rosella TaxID=1033263 RepID=A0AAD7GQF1_MYCRO|nr:hypothetical protein B0H17DRAFT_1195485 [Mycena rosella]
MSSSFDFVIVGGGTAGLALAVRLAEDAAATVCVLEAGEDYAQNEDVKIPGNYMTNIGKPFDGGLLSTPQAHSANRVIYNPRGKGLGGSSILNWLQVIRRVAFSPQSFETTLGAKGWNSGEFLKYFKKSQSLPQGQTQIKSNYVLKPDPALFGDGPIACAALGVSFNPVGGNGNNSGVWPALSAIDPKTVTRVSSASAYLEPNRAKSNLKVISQARATRILFKHSASTTAIATGVVYTLNSGEKEFTVQANKEVILCAGTFRTPQVLEMSGIGNKEHIQKGVTQIIDLPGVGNNLQKISKIKQMVAAADTTNTSIKSPSSIKVLQNWMSDENAYQLEFIMVPHHVPFLPNGEFNAAKKYCFFSIIVDHPFSRGSAHIDPASPAGNPIVDLGIFENEIDLEILAEGIKFIQKLIAQPSMRDDAGVRPIAPSPAIKSDEDIKEYIKQAAFTAYHPIGTASMLPREEFGVVDHNLVVYGTSNLRIADASIIPVHISAHPMATVYAIAEKAADIIKAAWK